MNEEYKSRRALRAKQLVEKVSMSRTHIDRLIAAGKFPKPYNLSERVVVWDEAEVDAWLDAKFARGKS